MPCVTGENHTICLSDEGVLHSFGGNSNGQLGIGELERGEIKVTIPAQITKFYIGTQIFSLPIIKQISCGAYFTVCVDYDGSLYSFGENYSGQLGTGNTMQYNFPQKVQDIPPVASISCGIYHTLAITFVEDLWSFGANEYGQLCLGNQINQNTPQRTPFSNM